MGETLPIIRYLGKVHGYYTKDPLEAAKIDRIVDIWGGYMNTYALPGVPMQGNDKNK